MRNTLSRHYLLLLSAMFMLVSLSAPSLACRACGAPVPIHPTDQAQTQTQDDIDSEDSAKQTDQEKEEREDPQGKPPR